MKKIISILLVVLLLIGCGSKTATPEATVSGFMDATKAFNFVKMIDYVHVDSEKSDELVDELEESFDTDEMELELFNYFKDNAKKIEYSIDNIVEDDDRATVSVTADYVDGSVLMGAVFEEYMGKIFELAFSGKEPSEEEISELLGTIMNEKIKEIEVEFITSTFEVELIKVNNKWLIDDVSNDLLNVMMSNFMFVIDGLEDLDDWE